MRGDKFFSTDQFGALTSDLAALSSFFNSLWLNPVHALTNTDKAHILALAGFRLRGLGRLAEATQAMQAALDARIEQENWSSGSMNAGHLSQIYLIRGNIAEALCYAKRAVKLANRGSDWKNLVTKRRTIWGDALHQDGNLQRAEEAFREAEGMQKKNSPQYTLIFSINGFRYRDLLLSQGKYQKVIKRSRKTLEWAKQGRVPLEIALEHLALGQACLLKAQREEKRDFSPAKDHIDQAVHDLRQAGHQEYITRGLFVQAELHRMRDEFEPAQRNLDEAMTIATRGGMRLYEADCHLEYTQLYLATSKRDKARESLTIAKKMIDEMGYHRRDPEILLETTHLRILEGKTDEARQTLNAAKKRIDEMGYHRWDWQVQELTNQP